MFEAIKTIEGHQTPCQDLAAIFQTPSGMVFVIADGAGGFSGGREAAEQTISTIQRRIYQSRFLFSDETCCYMLAEIDIDLLKNSTAGETTATIVVISPEGIMGASVGDTKAWLISSNNSIELTREQRAKPLLGTGKASPIPFTEKLWGSCVLVASDGLWKYTQYQKICETALKSHLDLEIASKELIDLVRLESGCLQDDTSVILCTIQKET